MSSPAPNTPAETQVPAITPVVETPASVVEAAPADDIPAADSVGENSGPAGPSLPSGVDARNVRQLSQSLARLGWGNNAEEAIELDDETGEFVNAPEVLPPPLKVSSLVFVPRVKEEPTEEENAAPAASGSGGPDQPPLSFLRRSAGQSGRQRFSSFDLVDTKDVLSLDDRPSPFVTAAPGARFPAAGPAQSPSNFGVPEAEHFRLQRQFGDDSVRPAAEEGRSGRAAEDLAAGETRGGQVDGFLGSFLPGEPRWDGDDRVTTWDQIRHIAGRPGWPAWTKPKDDSSDVKRFEHRARQWNRFRMADYWSQRPGDTVRNDPACAVCHRKRDDVPWARECRSVVKRDGTKQGCVCCNALGSTCEYAGKDSRDNVVDDGDDDARPREETPLESVRGRQASIERAAAAFNAAHRPRAGHTRGAPLRGTQAREALIFQTGVVKGALDEDRVLGRTALQSLYEVMCRLVEGLAPPPSPSARNRAGSKRDRDPSPSSGRNKRRRGNP